jgi:serine/threonine protein kinase/Rieske Fe-S protein
MVELRARKTIFLESRGHQMSTSLEQLVGQTVGHCRVEALLHHGRLSAVFRAQYLPQPQPVALTFFLPPANWPPQTHQQFMARFVRESAKLIAISHPNLLPIYERGERQGNPFLITPYVAQGSLATTLQQRGRCTPGAAMNILEQVTAGLGHAHRSGFIHRSLKLAHIIMPREQTIQVTGLGLAQLLEKRGLQQDSTPFANLQTIAGTMLVAPKYLAPECILGEEGDIRSDVYALGIILFEMLSGLSPFTNTLSIEAVMQRQRQTPPSLHSRFTDIPPALDNVLQQALAWEPAMRFQRVGELFSAFNWALQVKVATPLVRSTDPLQHAATAVADGNLQERPLCTSCPAAPAANMAARSPLTAGPSPADIGFSPDPIRGWPDAAALPGGDDEQYGLRRTSRQRAARHGSRRKQSRRGINRRQALALLMVGGGLVIGGVSLGSTNLAQLVNEAPHRASSSMPAAKKALAHMNQPLNSAQVFINPRDGKQGLLIRLPGGAYVAYERACTHVGVAVSYDQNTHLLVCPAHGSIFDPAHQGRVVQGPAARPLPRVALHTNPDGSVMLE